jgi:hypothetical protein
MPPPPSLDRGCQVVVRGGWRIAAGVVVPRVGRCAPLPPAHAQTWRANVCGRQILVRASSEGTVLHFERGDQKSFPRTDRWLVLYTFSQPLRGAYCSVQGIGYAGKVQWHMALPTTPKCRSRFTAFRCRTLADGFVHTAQSALRASLQEMGLYCNSHAPRRPKARYEMLQRSQV